VCGVAGMWGTFDGIAVRQMMDALVHRGPDDEGTYSAVDSSGMLGHQRPAGSVREPARIEPVVYRGASDCSTHRSGQCETRRAESETRCSRIGSSPPSGGIVARAPALRTLGSRDLANLPR
jgi:hypothetical protein